MQEELCSIDGGNSTIEVIINGRKVPHIYPTVQADAAGIKYSDVVRVQESAKSIFNKLHVGFYYNRTANENKDYSEFLFGHAAENQPKSIRNRENSDKSSDKELAKWMLTALAAGLYEKKTKGKDIKAKSMTFRVKLATGLPYHEADKPKCRENYGKMLLGSHLVKFLHPDFNGLEIEIIVEQVKVYVEGEAALETIISNPESEISKLPKAELLGHILVMVDIGGFSTEIVGIEFISEIKASKKGEILDEFDAENNEIEIYPITKTNLTTGIPKGVGTAMVETIADIRANEPSIKRELSRRDIEKAFGISGYYNGTYGWILPEKVNIKKYFDSHVRSVAVEIAKKLHGLYNANNVLSQVSRIYMTGGGSRIDTIVETIKEVLNDLGFDSKNIFSIEDPIFANAEGYYLAMEDELNIEGETV